MYTYTQANQLSAITASSLAWSAAYNGDGARLTQVANGTPTTYTVDLAAPLVTVLAQQDAESETQYLYGLGDSPLASYTGTWTHLSGRDGLNSVRQETDASGNVITARGFDPYGVPLDGNGGSPFGYTGEQTDSTGLVFLRARYMQPTLGIFLSRDQWDGDQRLPFTLHVYVYALADPVNRLDPSGLAACKPRCFIFYLTGVGNNLQEAGQPRFLDRLKEKLGAEVIPINPHPDSPPPPLQVLSAAYSTSKGEKDLARNIDQRLQDEKVQPLDEVNLIGWSGGAQMAVGSASQMQRHLSNIVLLGGAFRADEGLVNVGTVYDLLGDRDDVRSRRYLWEDLREWDRFNHGWWKEWRLWPPGPVDVYHPEHDLYGGGRITLIQVPGADHWGYFDLGADDIIVAQTKMCRPWLPTIFKD